MEKPVTFVNRSGFTLFGMLYAPDKPSSARRIGILISVNAIKYRAGTFRLHVLLARRLCQLGYFVFTFDPEGIGDSEGVFEYKLLSEHYYDIQTGKYDRDLFDAVDYFSSESRLDELLLLGLCGGAVSVLMEASSDSRVGGLILLNLPVLVEDLGRTGEADNAAKITSSEAAISLLKGKVSRLSQWNFWRSLLTLKVDFFEEAGLLGKSGTVLFKTISKQIQSMLPQSLRSVSSAAPAISQHPLFNKHVQSSFMRVMAAQKQILFVFADLDAWTWIFKSEFQDLLLKPGNAYENYCKIKVIDVANHIFSGRDSQLQLRQVIEEWLATNFQLPAPGSTAE